MKLSVSEVFMKAAAAFRCEPHGVRACEICIEEAAKKLGFETWNGEMEAAMSIEEAIRLVKEDAP